MSRSGSPAARQSSVAPRAFLRTPSRQMARVAIATIEYERSSVYAIHVSSVSGHGRAPPSSGTGSCACGTVAPKTRRGAVASTSKQRSPRERVGGRARSGVLSAGGGGARGAGTPSETPPRAPFVAGTVLYSPGAAFSRPAPAPALPVWCGGLVRALAGVSMGLRSRAQYRPPSRQPTRQARATTPALPSGLLCELAHCAQLIEAMMDGAQGSPHADPMGEAPLEAAAAAAAAAR